MNLDSKRIYASFGGVKDTEISDVLFVDKIYDMQKDTPLDIGFIDDIGVSYERPELAMYVTEGGHMYPIIAVEKDLENLFELEDTNIAIDTGEDYILSFEGAGTVKILEEDGVTELGEVEGQTHGRKSVNIWDAMGYHPTTEAYESRVIDAGGEVVNILLCDKEIREAIAGGYYDHIGVWLDERFGVIRDPATNEITEFINVKEIHDNVPVGSPARPTPLTGYTVDDVEAEYKLKEAVHLSKEYVLNSTTFGVNRYGYFIWKEGVLLTTDIAPAIADKYQGEDMTNGEKGYWTGFLDETGAAFAYAVPNASYRSWVEGAGMTNLLAMLNRTTTVNATGQSLTGLLEHCGIQWYLSITALIIIRDNPVLAGVIPAETGNLKSADRFYINQNVITGKLPIELAFMDNVTIFHIFDTNILGTLREAIFAAPSCNTLHLYDNQITSIEMFTSISATTRHVLLQDNQIGDTYFGELVQLLTLCTGASFNGTLNLAGASMASFAEESQGGHWGTYVPGTPQDAVPTDLAHAYKLLVKDFGDGGKNWTVTLQGVTLATETGVPPGFKDWVEAAIGV